MNISKAKLQNRTVSGFPISIGTSLALETIFDPIQPVYDETRVVPNKVDVTTYSLYLFNISTLLRNLLGALPESSDVYTLNNKDILETLQEEIEWLTYFFTNNNLNIKFYIHNYNYPKTYYKDKLRVPTTEKQLKVVSIFDYCLNKLFTNKSISAFSKDIHYDKKDSVLILTHVPWDLLSYSNFVKFDLLESHTGVVKTRKDWYTKYYKLPGDRDMSFLPFIEYLLVLFGDHVMFKPDKLEKRLEVYEMLKKKNVHPLMSEFALLTHLGKT